MASIKQSLIYESCFTNYLGYFLCISLSAPLPVLLLYFFFNCNLQRDVETIQYVKKMDFADRTNFGEVRIVDQGRGDQTEACRESGVQGSWSCSVS